MKHRSWLPVLCLLFLAVPLRSQQAAPNGPVVSVAPVELEPVLAALSPPTYLTNAGDGTNRLFVAEQLGRVMVVQPPSSIPTVFLDIDDRIRCCGEQGLLGLAFHPQYESNGRFFVNYTRIADSATVVAEYRVSGSDPNVADRDETVLLTISQPFSNHNGGMIDFGPDGFLYISTGDGGSGNDPGNEAQNLDSLLGKILRIDVDNTGTSLPYAIPSDNPFVGRPGRDEIFAYGLRNPWRFSFDRPTGRLYAADVGQDAVEEVNLIQKGRNYGWRVLEGTRCTNLGPAACNGDFVPPIAEYSNTGNQGRCSVTGGYVYRGKRLSLPLGSYVFGDFCSGEIFILVNGTQQVLMDTDLRIVSFAEDEQGEICVLGQSGSAHRIVNPEVPAVLTRYFPSLISESGPATGLDASEVTGFAVVNLDGADADLTFTAADANGDTITGADITNPSPFLLGSGEQLALVDTEIFGVGLRNADRPAWIRMDSSLNEVTGFFLNFNESLTVLDGANVSVFPLASAVLSEIENDGFSRVHIGNPHGVSAQAEILVIGANGITKGSVLRSVAKGAVLVEMARDLFPAVPFEDSDYLRVNSGEGLIVFEYFGKEGLYVQGVNGQDATAGGTTLYSPQYAVGGPTWWTAITVINLDPFAGTVTMELINAAGATLASSQEMGIGGHGKIRITDQSFFMNPDGSLIEGYVVIRSNGVRLAGSVVFGDAERNIFSATLPLVTRLGRRVVFSQVASNETYFTGLAFLNPNDGAIQVEIRVCDSEGGELGMAQETIEPRGRLSRLLTEWLPQLLGQDISEGFIKVSFTGDAAAFGLYGTRQLSVLSAIAAQTVP